MCYTRPFDLASEPPQAPVRGHPDCPGTLAHDPGHVTGIRPATTRNMMISAWSRGSDAISAIEVCVATASSAWSAASGEVSRCSAALTSSSLASCGTAGRRPVTGGVSHPVPGDGEQPRPEGLLLAAEPRQSVDHLQPRITGHVLGFRRDHPQVAQQRRLHVTEDAREGRLITGLSAGQRDPERGSDHRSSIGPPHQAAQHKQGHSRHDLPRRSHPSHEPWRRRPVQAPTGARLGPDAGGEGAANKHSLREVSR